MDRLVLSDVAWERMAPRLPVIVRLGMMTVHRCQVVALDGFNSSIRILIAVKLMDVMMTPLAQSIPGFPFKGRLGHSGQQSAVFQPDLR